VVLTVEAVPGKGGVPGTRTKTSTFGEKQRNFELMHQWNKGSKEIMYRDADTGILSTKILPGSVVKVRMPEFASIDGRDVTEPGLSKDVNKLVSSGALIPESKLDKKGCITDAFVVLDVESSSLPLAMTEPVIAQWLADGRLIMCQDVVTPGMLFDKPLASGTYKVKMINPAFNAVNGRDVTKVGWKEIKDLVFSGKLVPQKNTSTKKYVVVLDVGKGAGTHTGTFGGGGAKKPKAPMSPLDFWDNREINVIYKSDTQQYNYVPHNMTVNSKLKLSRKVKDPVTKLYERRILEKGEEPDGGAIREEISAGALPVRKDETGYYIEFMLTK
jgi:hypothetical protein